MLFFDLMKGMAEIDRMREAYELQIKKAMKVGITEALRQVTISTPVDTGRARWGWYLSVKVPSTEVPPEGKYKSPQMAEKLQAVNENFTVKDTLYLTNNVPYIKRLNDGSSKQAPAHFAERSAEIAQQAVYRWLKQPNTFAEAAKEFGTNIRARKGAVKLSQGKKRS